MRHIKKCIFIIPVILFSILITGCNDNAWDKHLSTNEQSDKDLFEVISSKPELSVFVAMLKKTGYNQILQNPNSYTVFAPDNSAWIGVDTSNVEQMRKIVGTLIVYNTYFKDNENLYKSVKAVNDKTIFYNSSEQTFNGAKITTFDIMAGNGVIHITDKIIERKENIWDYVSTKTENQQSIFIKSLNKRVMDMDKSVAVGVYPNGKTKYDTIWKNINYFLTKYPIDSEDSLYTYILLEDEGYDLLYEKYKPYFNLGNINKTDSVTKFNVCQDFVFKGIVDITKFDTITNVDGVKVPVANVEIKDTYNASNGRVYIIKQSDIKLKSKIKPIKIEGEKYNKASDANYVFTRYKLWASGERDIAMSSAETQSDTLWRKTTGLRDSVVSKTYFVNSGLVANVANFYIEYKAQVNSCNYDVYYVAYDDIADHFDSTYRSFGVYKIVQKLFISLPGNLGLQFGITDNARGVNNNFAGPSRCFVGHGMAGKHELTKLRLWDLALPNQTVSEAVPGNVGETLPISRTGIMTMWLCNTARSNTASRQGLLFLDYILLVPRITE